MDAVACWLDPLDCIENHHTFYSLWDPQTPTQQDNASSQADPQPPSKSLMDPLWPFLCCAWCPCFV